jgi:hypothetical protein
MVAVTGNTLNVAALRFSVACCVAASDALSVASAVNKVVELLSVMEDSIERIFTSS